MFRIRKKQKEKSSWLRTWMWYGDRWLVVLSMIPPFFFYFFITADVLLKFWGFRVSSLGRVLKKILKEDTCLVLCRQRRPLMHLSSFFYTKLRVFARSILAQMFSPSEVRTHRRSDSSKLDWHYDCVKWRSKFINNTLQYRQIKKVNIRENDRRQNILLKRFSLIKISAL